MGWRVGGWFHLDFECGLTWMISDGFRSSCINSVRAFIKYPPDAVDVVDGWTGCRLPEAGCRSTPAGGGIRTEAGMGGAGALCATEAHTWRFEQKKNT